MASLSATHFPTSQIYPAFDPSRKDRFGLPLVPILVSKEWCEDKEAARQLARDAFATVATYFGHDEALRLFAEAARKRPRGKQADRRKNEMILACYDTVMSERGNPDGSLPAHVADLLRSNVPDFRHVTAKAIEKRIRRLLKERDARQAKEESCRILASQTIGGGRDK